MAKYKTTRKAIREEYGNANIYSVNYCGLQNMLCTTEPFAYSTRTEGWACDYYELPDGIIISTGYAPIGKYIPYETVREFENYANKICAETWSWDERKPRLDALIADFIGTVKANERRSKC